MDIRNSDTEEKIDIGPIDFSEENQISEQNKSDQFSSLAKEMLAERTYPLPDDKNFQEKIYTKRDYYIHKVPARNKLETYDEVKEFRDKTCPPHELKLTDPQASLANFINPNTPYKGILIFWGTGVGKSCASVAIGEKFKPMVEKYGTRIHVLVPGPLNKQNYLEEIIKCTGETYLATFKDKTLVLDENEKTKLRKNAIGIINQYYRIMTHKSFYKKVLGEKITEKVTTDDNKLKLSYRKTETGEYERDVSIDRIYNLDNTLLIIDEAHNLTDNEYGEAVRKIIDASKNLKIVLLSATPMKNLADQIVELINYIRPKNSQMIRDKIFTTPSGHLMEFKDGGKEYFRNMVRGYVSYLRGSDPLTFAERVDMGEIPPGLSFTKLTRCYMMPFQLQTYKKVVETYDDTLDRKSEAVANFVFPGLGKNKSELEGYYGIEGMNEVKSQLRANPDAIGKMLATTLFSDQNIADPSSLIYLTDNSKNISGDIFGEKYLKHFSIKFYKSLKKINQNVYGKRGPGILFAYANLVRVGIELFQEVLQRNGFLEYQESMSSYIIKNNTKCYFCGYSFGEHKNLPNDIPPHEFHPATYLTVTGQTEEAMERIPEEKHRIIKNVFNTIENKDGKLIKIILGSRVMSEGITLKNIKEIHILDVHYHLGKVDQTIGRGIRFCTHYEITNESTPFPQVEVYKYVISTKDGLSTEEELYQKAEKKYMLIKETERIMEEEAIDCPLNYNANIFPEELKRYENCGSKDNPCPAICGYLPCKFKCGDKLLNSKYYDPESGLYKKVEKAQLDYSTYDNSLASDEIEYAKSRIKEMFHLEHIYTLKDILKYIKQSFPEEKQDMFDDFYVYQALNDLIPITTNDFNNFRDTIVDKFNRPGYLIYRDKYYIFQPFDENEELPMYYRKNYRPGLQNKLNLRNYIYNTQEYQQYKSEHKTENELEKEEIRTPSMVKKYDFDSVLEYYDSRDEFKYVGIIDQESVRKRGIEVVEPVDVFKIREKRPKFLIKKRETGIPSFKGAVCRTSKDKDYLRKIMKALKLSPDVNSRDDICILIRDKLYDLEKYSTKKEGNKMTYLIVPANHPTIQWPLNMEDRIKNILNKIKDETRLAVKPKIDVTKTKGRFPDISYVKYKVIFDKSFDKFKQVMELYGAKKTKDGWVMEMD